MSTPPSRRVRFSIVARARGMGIKMRSKSLGPTGSSRSPKKLDKMDKDRKGKLMRRRSFSFSRNSRYFHARSRSRSKSREDDSMFTSPELFQKQKQFGVPFGELPGIKLAEYDAEIPTVLVRLKDYLTNNQGILTDGIFRVNPGTTERDLVKSQLNEGTFHGCEDIHCVSNMIKVWFRDLPCRILDDIDVSDVQKSIEPKDIPRTARVAHVILAMSEPERSIVLWLLDLCILVTSHSDVNRMTPRNMAIVLAPNLWEPSKHDAMLFMSLNQTFTDFLEQAICWRASQQRERNFITERVKKLTLDRLDEMTDEDSCDEIYVKKRVSFGTNDIRTFESESSEDERKSDSDGEVAPISPLSEAGSSVGETGSSLSETGLTGADTSGADTSGADTSGADSQINGVEPLQMHSQAVGLLMRREIMDSPKVENEAGENGESSPKNAGETGESSPKETGQNSESSPMESSSPETPTCENDTKKTEGGVCNGDVSESRATVGSVSLDTVPTTTVTVVDTTTSKSKTLWMV